MATTAAFGQSKTKIYGKVEVQSEFEATLSVVGANLTLEPIAKAQSVNGEFVIEIESPAQPTMGWLYMLGSVHGVVVEPGEITFEYSRQEGTKVAGGHYNALLYAKEELSHWQGLLAEEEPYIRLFALLELNTRSKGYYDKLVAMEELLPGSLEIKRVKKVREEEIKRAAVAKEVAVGGHYKNFEALTPAGERVQLQEYIKNNNYTLLEVWASWCNPCIKTIKQLPPIVTIRPNASCSQILRDLSLLKKYEKIFITHDRDPIQRDLF